MSYNFLRNARSIKNSFLCRHDRLDAYSSDFHENGNVDGWDQYSHVYLYGCWNGTLFGTAWDRDCYVGRTNVFQYVPAEDYYLVKIMMKITNNNSDKYIGHTTSSGITPPPPGGLTTGRIQWVTLSDSGWDATKQIDFDITADDKWRLYTINMGPKKNWQGNVNNLRIYPFIDGWEGDEFSIKYIKISSLDKWKCSNTQCSYYLQYSHPCPGAGKRPSCEAGVSKSLYTTRSGISDKLIVNIDNYGDEELNLGDNTNLDGIEMSRIINNRLSSLKAGGYAFAEVEYSEIDKIKISSGNVGSSSSIKIGNSPAAEALGFYDSENDISTYEAGIDSATGFDYASSRILRAFEINNLLDGNKENFAYIHNPEQYNVEGGRRDFNEIGTYRLSSDILGNEYYEPLNNKGKTLIDLSHPINANGRIKAIYLYGKIDSLSKVKICRPHKDGTLTVIHSLNLPTEGAGMYTTRSTNYRLDCNILVSKGDLIGIYNANLYVGVSITGDPDATFYQIDGEVAGTFYPGRAYAFGIAGFAIYARSDRYQNNAILDIDLGNRVNIEEVNLYGKEEAGYFEFNIASCLDVNWEVDLFGHSHYHTGTHMISMLGFTDTHANVAYGLDCLDDCVVTADNGSAGDSINSHVGTSYFFVNGDAEWLWKRECDGKHEYCWPRWPNGVYGFTYDPIAFTLKFPYGYKAKIHKSIMYFKEKNNFRSVALSYYLGQQDSSGNADDPYFRLIPKYNSIRLDGLLYEEDDGSAINTYIFKNPTYAKIDYARGDKDPINWEEYAATFYADWTAIEHDFDPIECYGFRIYTNHHNSTKVTELEVYNKVETIPSLLDNINLSFSDYGDVWKSASFDEVGLEKVTAFIGGAPRYILLELESSTEFNLNEIEFLVGDQVKLGDCDNNVLLENSKTGAINQSTPIVLENIYNKPFDLIVDLPKETHESDDIVFWSKLGSQEEIDNPEIGPGCILHKADDHEIKNDNSQCAINVPCYGLKNLIDGKKAYVMENKDVWQYYGVLSSGISLDYCNSGLDYKESRISFPAVSSKYWKIVHDDDIILVDDLTVYHDDEKQDILNVYTWSAKDNTSQKSPTIHSNGIDIIGSPLRNDITGIAMIPSWTVSGTGTVTINNADIIATSYPDESGGPEVISEFSSMTDFTLYLEFILYRANVNRMGRIFVSLLDGGDNEIVEWHITDSWVGNQNTKHRLYDKGVELLGAPWVTINNSPTVVNSLYIKRQGSNLIYELNGTEYYNSSFSTDAVFKIKILFQRTAGYTPPDKNAVYFPSYKTLGFSLNSSDPLNKILFRHARDFPSIEIWISPDNGDNYSKWADAVVDYSDQNFYQYFAIDLEKRHDIDIIRNYGNATDKLSLSTSSYVDYSSSNTSNIDNVIWANSDKNDVRWLRIKLLCGDGTDRCIRKLGIYPDISDAYCIGGGYNCEWEPVGNILSDYMPSLNVAYGATVTGTNYYFMDYYPTNAVDGIFDNHQAQACWGFQKVDSTDPCLEIDFGDTYKIYKIKLYHGNDPSSSAFMNKNYTFDVSASISGSFTNILNITSNSEHEIIHQFDPVDARLARLTITDYDYERRLIYNYETGMYEEFKGSFLREIEVYTYVDQGYIDSEAWPVVCMNLKDQFNIVDHDLINKDITDTDTDWDNDEEFFKYSDNIWDDPKKVSFTRAGDYVIIYEKTADSGNVRGSMEYLFDQAVYLEEGRYNVEWYSYYAEYANEISLRFEGNEVIDFFAENLGTGYIKQSGIINIPSSGFYDIKAVQHISADYNWGAQNPKVYRSYGYTKWVGIIRDTAENYSYDDDSGKYGKDYLSLIKIYGDIKYNPLEYNWWWFSSISELDNDSINVKIGVKSLKISYPISSDTDEVYFIEGDNFGKDVYWSIKDLLSFWWLIDDIDKLDTTFGDITFGIINGSDPIYYKWNISNLNLKTGWNNIKLGFKNYDSTYPAAASFGTYPFLDKKSDFRINDRSFESIRLRYRGKGYSFTMNIDDLKIERNIFEDGVKFDKGLCLTGQDYLKIPVSGIDLKRGSIEFWLKTHYDSNGRGVFDEMNSRTLFTMINNNNDLISLGIRSNGWFEISSGHIRRGLNLFSMDESSLPLDAFIDINEIIHLAVVWSHDGEFMDNGDTLRFYINEELICGSKDTWEVSDTKSMIIRLGGFNTQLAGNQDFWGGGIFDNVKIYNYCKTDFGINEEGVSKAITYTPNEFLEISKDDINFYNMRSSSLPLIFEQVPAGEKRTVYVRSNKDDNFKRSKKTASLIVEWLTTV